MTATATALEPDLARLRRERLARLRAAMADAEVEGLVLLHGPNVTYASGFVPAALDVTHANHRRSIAFVSADPAVPVHLHPHGGDPSGLGCAVGAPRYPELDDDVPAFAEAMFTALGDIAGRRIGVDIVTGALARAEVFGRASLTDAGPVTAAARLVKTEDELRCIDLAQRTNETAMVDARLACAPGATRREVAGVLLQRLHELGAHHCEIDPIFERMPRRIVDGHETSTGHVAFPTGVDDPTFAEGDLIWVDSGIGYEGYASDFGRTWIVGRDPDRAEVQLFERFVSGMDASYGAIRAGATLGDVGRAAIDANDGEVPWLPHFYLAHGLGLDSAEMPMIGTDLGQRFDDGFELAPGMVLVLEPVIWEDGVGSYRAEEICAVTDDGWRHLGGGHPYDPFER